MEMEKDNDSKNIPEGVSETNIAALVLNVSNLERNLPMCRICYGGPSSERLVQPCKCKGTIQYVHRHCLETWLQCTNYESCELCNHHFAIRRTRKSMWDFFRLPDTRQDRRNMFGDLACCALMTPLGIATFWLCAEGAIFFQRVKHTTMETVALVALAVFLVLAYATWILLCSRYHLIIFNRWRNRNWNVQVLDRPSQTSSRSSSNYSTSPEVSQNILLQPLVPLSDTTVAPTDRRIQIASLQTTPYRVSVV